MLLKILGILDIICSLFILSSSLIPVNITRLIGFILLIKGILFGIIIGIGYGGLNFVSIIDAAIGLYLIIGVKSSFFSIIFFIFLLQKGIFSMF
ncbi:MAG: hypothetical protein QXY45_01060 [Candidatus Aenigmatarchaeota archaeon]